MKKQARTDRKLPLCKETVRTLEQLALAEVAGGVPILTFHTLRTCADC